MTDSTTRAGNRRAAVEREILDAAWSVMAREGAAALSVREVARSVGLRQQSLTHYFPTKQALFDALFAEGFADLRIVLDRVPDSDDPIDAVVAVAEAVVEYCSAHPARYHLMLQRTVPGFAPSPASHKVALGCLGVLVDRLTAAGTTEPGDVALVRGLISGLAAEQIANEPGGRHYVSQTARGITALLGLRQSSRFV
jgi:AcrR family transcriptional regulator